MAQQVSGVMCFSADMPAAAGTVTMTVPEGWMVLEVISNIQVVLGGADVIEVGYTAAVDAFLADADQGTGAVGIYLASEGSAAKANGYKLGVGEAVLITRTGSTSGGGEEYVLAAQVVA